MKNKKGTVKIHVPTKGNKLLEMCLEKINQNDEIYALWDVINVNAIDRLGMSDHGPVHFQIVSNIALRLSRMLSEANVEMSIVKDFGLSYHHAELVVFLTSIMHDLGMSINREGHEEYSLFLSNNLLHEILTFLPTRERVIISSEVLHAIISHRKNGIPNTIEAGIVRVADALDMSEGRSRIPYEKGEKDIYAISAAAIDKVEIKKGSKKIIQIFITLNNSAGIFQIDELLKSKLKKSRIEKFVEVKDVVAKETEKKLINTYTL